MKKLSNLKALLLSFMLVACFVLPMKAQKSDGFFRNNELYQDRDNGIGLGGATQENPTPVGSGLLILTIAGAGYVIVRRKSCKSYNSSVTLFLAFTLLLGLTQCKKNEIAPSVDNGVYITLDAGYGSAKTGFTPSTGEFVWSDGVTEYIYVGGSEHADCLGVLSGTGTGTGSMTFSGTLTTTPNDKETLHFFYLGKGRDGSAVSTLDFSNQDGTLENVTNYHIAVGDGSYTSGAVNYATTLDMTMAIAYFNVSGYQNASETAETVYLHGEDVYTTATVDYQTGMITGATKGYLNMGTATASKYVALIPSVTTETTLKFDSNSKTGTMTFNRGIQAGKYYANSDAALEVTAGDLPEGTLKGIFSVSATKKVRFSKGNLQCTTNATPDGNGHYDWSSAGYTWSFMEHQYDYGVTEAVGNNHENSNKVTHFGWGTSGYNNQVPYKTDGGASSYGGSGDMIGTNYDWGVYNSANITNGGGCTTWRTPDINEWRYLFQTRSCSTVNNVIDARFTSACVNTGTEQTANGIIFFPDDYYGGKPDGVTWGDINWRVNWATICTVAGWTSLEAAGCLFLPAAGGRGGYYVSTYGDYWSSTGYYSDRAWKYYFSNSSGASGTVEKYRNEDCAVRLVRDL